MTPRREPTEGIGDDDRGCGGAGDGARRRGGRQSPGRCTGRRAPARRRCRAREDRAPVPADPVVAAAARTDTRRCADPGALGAPRARRRRQSLGRAARRVQLRAGRVPAAALQRVHHVPALRAPLPLWRREGPRQRRHLRFPDPRLPAQGRRQGASHVSRALTHAGDLPRRPRRPLLLLRHRRRRAGASRSTATTCASTWCRTRCIASAAPTRPTGTRKAGVGTASRRSNGWRPTVGCWRRRTTRSAITTSRSSASIARPASRRTGASCCSRSSPTIPSEKGLIRYRQVEYGAHAGARLPRHGRRPRCSRAATSCASASSPRRARATTCPIRRSYLDGFEQRYCYDQFWNEQRKGHPGTRTMSCGHAFAMVGDARESFFVDREGGLLGQFRHQYFLLFLIPHIHKATLLMLSDRMADALNRLDIRDPESVKQLQADDPPAPRDLPALHAPLLVPRGVRPAAGARDLSHDRQLPRQRPAVRGGQAKRSRA